MQNSFSQRNWPGNFISESDNVFTYLGEILLGLFVVVLKCLVVCWHIVLSFRTSLGCVVQHHVQWLLLVRCLWRLIGHQLVCVEIAVVSLLAFKFF